MVSLWTLVIESLQASHSENPSIYSSYDIVCESNGGKVIVGESSPVAIMEGHAECFPSINTSDSIHQKNGTYFTGRVRGIAGRKQITGLFISWESVSSSSHFPTRAAMNIFCAFPELYSGLLQEHFFSISRSQMVIGLLISSQCSLYGSYSRWYLLVNSFQNGALGVSFLS